MDHVPRGTSWDDGACRAAGRSLSTTEWLGPTSKVTLFFGPPNQPNGPNRPNGGYPTVWTTGEAEWWSIFRVTFPNCSNSVSFHAICLKFFLVGSLKISLRVLAFSELSGRLPLATFAVLVHLFCFFHRKYFLSLPSPVTLTFSNLSFQS